VLAGWSWLYGFGHVKNGIDAPVTQSVAAAAGGGNQGFPLFSKAKNQKKENCFGWDV